MRTSSPKDQFTEGEVEAFCNFDFKVEDTDTSVDNCELSIDLFLRVRYLLSCYLVLYFCLWSCWVVEFHLEAVAFEFKLFFPFGWLGEELGFYFEVVRVELIKSFRHFNRAVLHKQVNPFINSKLTQMLIRLIRKQFHAFSI